MALLALKESGASVSIVLHVHVLSTMKVKTYHLPTVDTTSTQTYYCSLYAEAKHIQNLNKTTIMLIAFCCRNI